MRLFLDACALIYRFEGTPAFRAATVDLIAQLSAEQPTLTVAVSRLSVLECRVKPLRDGNAALLKRYADLFAAVQVVELSAAVVDVATRLRVRYGLKTPDALQLACALDVSAPVTLLTADKAFNAVTEPGLQVRLIDLPHL
jgi:predicted nucleic acid-binding protein